MMPIDTLTTVEEVTAAARSRLYRLLADGFLYPDRTFFAALKAGRYRDDVVESYRSLSYGAELEFDELVATGSYVDFQAQYLRIFEVGMGTPPCPLYGGLHRGGRKAVMEELTRFYNFFGLSLEQGAGELPDHVTTELEFMHFLAFKELSALCRDEDVTPYRRAQYDFLDRQLISWLPSLAARLEGLAPPPLFYTALSSVTNAFVRAEHSYIREMLGQMASAVLEGAEL